MFGFGLKGKAKKILNNHFNREGGWTPSWLNSIVSQGKSQGYNEYDVVIWYLITDWQWSIDTWKDIDDSPETTNRLYEEINEEIELLNQISHLAHEDTGFHSKVIEIKEASKLLKK
mgnify:FL=1|tara:strand:+ start:683 stop:1030 length:348 start_codon:yes stop_codon:yes gene_type:complete